MSQTVPLSQMPHVSRELPNGPTAQSPPERRGLRRDQVRLLVADPTALLHRDFHDLPRHLNPGDLLVVNDSATLPAELDGRSESHGAVVVHVGPRLENAPEMQRVIELRTSPDASRSVLDGHPGEEIQVAGGARFRLLEPYPRPRSSPTGEGSRLWRARVVGIRSLEEHLALHGRPIAYGYLADRFPLDCYQTVFGWRPGSSEMPSAARPFTQELVTRLIAGGIGIATITLHTGLSSQDAGEHPQAEWFEVTPAAATLVNATRQARGRVVAVGTTAVRALESAADREGRVRPVRGWTELVITGGRPVWAVDGVVTGWHDSHASHVELIEAVAGARLVRAAYAAAAEECYLWHEFGDSSLLLAR
jgi:S-adenosylmethionine:tRNA ribosyltransferase-isomerase